MDKIIHLMIESPLRYHKTSSAGIPLEFIGHSSIEEYDAEAGIPNAALCAADGWLVHRDTIDDFNEQFTPIAEKLSGVLRLIDKKKTDKARKHAVNPKNVAAIRESMVTFLNRITAAMDEEKKAELYAAALALSQTIRISSAPAERKTPIEPMFYKRADSILECDLATINLKLSKFLSVVPDFDLARDEHEKPTRLSLARLLQKFDSAIYADED